jgi:adenylate cyclase
MKSDKLLLNILPYTVAKNLQKRKQIGTLISEKYDDVTILVADIVGYVLYIWSFLIYVRFTVIASKTSPKEIVSLLNELFSEFDTLCSKYGLEKIKTIGDAYVAAGGLPTRNAHHAQAVVEMAWSMINSPVLKKNCLVTIVNIISDCLISL